MASAVAAALLLATPARAAPPTEAELLCPSGVGGSLLANSTRLTAESRLYQASYSTVNWTGGLRAIGVKADGSLITPDVWNASDAGKIPAAGVRRIFTASSATVGVNFTWADIGTTLQSQVRNEATLNYLRGDQTNEQAGSDPLFRQRSSRLGAIVNSELAYAGAEDFGYEALVDTSDLTTPASVAGLAYLNFLQTKRTRTKLVIAGANDGMLHGFDADTGAEKFAYVPRTLLLEPISVSETHSTLVRLADPAFTRRYYVDGSPWVGDAYWDGAWHTAVVGTTGAGGKGVFALDITDPDAMAAGKLRWDIDGRTDADMGYAFGEPVIGRLSDGNFYAFFGNGRESQNQCAVLYVVRLGDGQVRRISTGGTCSGNGLGRPSLYDIHRQGETGFRTTDFVYAGDLQGNLWRFDLRSVNLGNDPATGASVQLMFTASNGSNEVQPITGTIEIGAGPAGVTGDPRPAMLWFGTGRYLTAADLTNTDVQSMYGIVDRFSGGGSASTAKVSRDRLVPLTADTSSGKITYVGTTTEVNYSGSGQQKDGWYLDLPRSGERMVGQPLIQSGRLLFATLVPSTCPATGSNGIGSGSSWIYAVDPYHGRALTQRAFAGNPTVDFIASSVGIVRNLVSIDAGIKTYLYAGGATAGGGGSTIQFVVLNAATPTGPRGRVSWREIVK